jgi:hypothetical protein
LILREASLMSVSPLQKVLKPSPVPGPVTVKLNPLFDSLISSATAVEMGSTVDEPETLIVPVMAAADGAVPLDAAVVGAATLGAVLGDVDAPLFEQAPNAMVAINASAPTRLVIVIVTRCFLLMTAFGGLCGRISDVRIPRLMRRPSSMAVNGSFVPG